MTPADDDDPPTQRRARPPSEPTEVLRPFPPKGRRKRPSDPTEVLGPFPILTSEPVPATEQLSLQHDEQGDDELDEPAPAAIRPLGQLGATVLTSRPNHRAALPASAVTAPEPDDGLGVIVDDDETPESELPPTLPPAFLEARSSKAKRSQAAKLEAWLGLKLEDSDSGPPTAALDEQNPPETSGFDARLIEQSPLPFDSEVSPETRAPSTSPTVAEPSASPLPFESAALDQSERLERWLLGQVAEPDQTPAPQAQANPLVRPPDPLQEAAATSPVSAPASSRPEEPAPSFELVELGLYAQVRATVWHQTEPLVKVLERYGIDELRWGRNERYQEDRLREEAAAGSSRLAREIQGALCTARAQQLAEAESQPSPMGLKRYAAVRVILESATDPERLEVLARHDLTPKRWDAIRRHWVSRAHGDRQLARRVRRALASARRGAASRES